MKSFGFFIMLSTVVLLSSCSVRGTWLSSSNDPKKCRYVVCLDAGHKDGRIFTFKEIFADSVRSVEGVWVKNGDKITLYAQGERPSEFCIRQLSMNYMTLDEDGEIFVFRRLYYYTNGFIGNLFEYSTDYLELWKKLLVCAVLILLSGYFLS